MIRALLFWTLILCACSPIFPSPEAAPQNDIPTTQQPSGQIATSEILTTSVSPSTNVGPTDFSLDSPNLPVPSVEQTLQTPHVDQPPDSATTTVPSSQQQCGYQWAYQDLPETSNRFLQSVRSLQAEAQVSAFGFGENCVHADGSSDFIPMETDFNVTLQVANLSDNAALGEWIVKIMQIIESIPADQIIGPRPGRVSISFESNGQRQGVNFYIDQYHSLATGLSNAEIYQALQTPQ